MEGEEMSAKQRVKRFTPQIREQLKDRRQQQQQQQQQASSGPGPAPEDAGPSQDQGEDATPSK